MLAGSHDAGGHERRDQRQPDDRREIRAIKGLPPVEGDDKLPASTTQVSNQALS